jgi:hypothetical protein
MNQSGRESNHTRTFECFDICFGWNFQPHIENRGIEEKPGWLVVTLRRTHEKFAD